jgi:hypothetical protein
VCDCGEMRSAVACYVALAALLHSTAYRITLPGTRLRNVVLHALRQSISDYNFPSWLENSCGHLGYHTLTQVQSSAIPVRMAMSRSTYFLTLDCCTVDNGWEGHCVTSTHRQWQNFGLRIADPGTDRSETGSNPSGNRSAHARTGTTSSQRTQEASIRLALAHLLYACR